MITKRSIESLNISKPSTLGTSLITLYIPANTDI